MSTTPSKPVSSLLERARAKAASAKKAGIGSIPEDPTKSPASIPPADPASPSLPSQSKPTNTDGAPVTTVPAPETKPAISGEGKVPNPTPGPDTQTTDQSTLLKEARAKAASLLAGVAGIHKQAAAQAAAPAAAAAAPAAPAAAAEKQAAAENVELTDSYHAKIASIMLGSEKGRQLVCEHLEEVIGRVDAMELVKSAAVMHQQFEQIGAEQLAHQEQVLLAEQQLHQEKVAFAQAYAAMTPEQQAVVTKIQDNIKEASARIADLPEAEILQQWIIKGASDAGMMMDQGGMGAPPPPEGGEGGGEMGVEQLVQLIQQLVQSGEISPEEAQQVVELLAQELGAGGGAPPAESEAMKMASAVAAELVPDFSTEGLVKAASALQPTT